MSAQHCLVFVLGFQSWRVDSEGDKSNFRSFDRSRSKFADPRYRPRGRITKSVTVTTAYNRTIQQLALNFRQRDCEAARGPREGRGRAAGGPRDGCPNFIGEILRLKKTTSRCGRCSTPGHNLTVFAWRRAVALELANATPPSYDLFSSFFRVGLLSKVVEGQNGAPQDHM